MPPVPPGRYAGPPPRGRETAACANAIADALTEHIGWVPISIRTLAADAAIAVARGWLAGHPGPHDDHPDHPAPPRPNGS